ncbi:hypothetical protein [Rhodopirellula bahusiensis]|uniref:hypothetical protein n=1 Tax=Rhodopirellula bahusiensis TaxID=2014065 RepID=UPI003266393D
MKSLATRPTAPSLTSIDRAEVVAISLTTEEYNADDVALCEQRINDEMARNDLRVALFLRSVDTFDAPAGISFQELQKLQTPPKLFYSDIYDPNAEAEMVREESFHDFINGGGTILDMARGT